MLSSCRRCRPSRSLPAIDRARDRMPARHLRCEPATPAFSGVSRSCASFSFHSGLSRPGRQFGDGRFPRQPGMRERSVSRFIGTKPSSSANFCAPAPTMITWLVFSITVFATSEGFLIFWIEPTAPQRRDRSMHHLKRPARPRRLRWASRRSPPNHRWDRLRLWSPPRAQRPACRRRISSIAIPLSRCCKPLAEEIISGRRHARCRSSLRNRQQSRRDLPDGL